MLTSSSIAPDGSNPGPRLFRVFTFHGTPLCRLDNGNIGYAANGTNSVTCVPVLLCTTDADSTGAILMTETAEDVSLALPREPWSFPFFPIRRLPLARETECALAHPYSGLMLIALPEAGPDGFGRCAISRWREAGGWETYQLEEVLSPDVAVAQRAQRAAMLLQAGRGEFLSTASGETYTLGETEAIGRLIGQRHLEGAAQRMLDDDAFASEMLRRHSDDPYALGLSNLCAWRHSRVVTTVDNANDGRFAFMSRPGFDGTFDSIVHKLTATARRRILPSKTLCVLATARDEGPYILEWIAYHRSVGVEHFFIYSNDNVDGSDALLKALHNDGVITWIQNTGSVLNVQAKAYAHALAIVPQVLDYEWVAIIDLDEMVSLRPGTHRTLPNYITSLANQPTDVIALSWAVYWSNGRTHWSDDLSIARFCRQNVGSSLTKSLIRPRKFAFSQPHNPGGADASEPIIVRDSSGAQVRYARGELTGHEMAGAIYGNAWINHYFSRSAEEFFWKWSRNRVDVLTIPPFADIDAGFLANFMAHHDRADMTVPDAMAGRADGVRAEMDRLLRGPGVTDAQAGVVKYRAERACHTAAIVAGIDRDGLGPHHRAFLDLIQ